VCLDDLVRFYRLLFAHILSGKYANASPYSRYYVAAKNPVEWKHIATLVGATLKRTGKLEDGKPQSISASTLQSPCVFLGLLIALAPDLVCFPLQSRRVYGSDSARPGGTGGGSGLGGPYGGRGRLCRGRSQIFVGEAAEVSFGVCVKYSSRVSDRCVRIEMYIRPGWFFVQSYCSFLKAV
jgi:hypothetical protein